MKLFLCSCFALNEADLVSLQCAAVLKRIKPGCSLVVEPPGGDRDCFSAGASLVPS